MAKPNVRLSRHIYPEKYRLTLKPDLESFVFEGGEVIDIVLGKKTKEITLHSKDLDILSVEFSQKNEVEFAKNIKYDEKKETATFKFLKILPAGRGQLKISFKGLLNDKMRGFYRSAYQHQGKTKHLATTQFEATDARRAFPCFDEPAMKAVFEVNLLVPPHHLAISNTLPSEIQEHDSGYKVVNFAPSPKMSTYLLAFIVGEFEFLESKTKDGVQVRVYTVSGKKHQAKFALEIAKRCLEFYNQYFGIPYPLKTLDMIAIPDFESAAMENWGAITYRESALLVDDEKTSTMNKQWVAIVIAHEIAHQWFGNLVTMHWWTDLWLNEGFASYMEHLATAELFPKWQIWEQFVSGRYGDALQLDSLKNTHPIEVEVHHPDEINEIFDAVSYAKGASIIRMLAEYVGREKFRKGLKTYLTRHSYGNTKTADLWKALEQASGKPVAKIMKAWTTQAGYPIVRVEQQGKNLRLTQERFFSSEVESAKYKKKELWPVPVGFKQLTTRPLELLLDRKFIQVSLKSSLIKINPGQTGFYRVAYPKEQLLLFKHLVERNELSAVDKVGILSDYFALARAGLNSLTEFLDLAKSFKKETDYIIWEELGDSFVALQNLLAFESFNNDFHKFALELFSPIAKKVGWQGKKGEGHTQSLLRSLVLSAASRFGDAVVINKARTFYEYIKNGDAVNPDLRGLAYVAAAENGGHKEHRELLELYSKTELHEEQNRIGRALASFKYQDLLEKTLEFCFDPKKVRLQDAPFIIAPTWLNPYGKVLAWNFVKDNWKEILKRYGEGGHWLGRFVMPAASFTTLDYARDFEKFFKTHAAPGAARSIQQVLERIKSNHAFLARDRDQIGDFFRKA